MQYALLPELRDTTPGNAADHYRQAIKNMKQACRLGGNGTKRMNLGWPRR